MVGEELFRKTAEKLPVIVPGSRALILQHPDLYALVDDDLYEEISQRTWHLAVMGPYSCYVVTTVRAETKCGFTSLYLHRFVLNPTRGKIADHKDGNVLDNRMDNLRLATPTTSSRNQGMKRRSSMPYKGIQRSPSGKWNAKIRDEHGLRQWLGSFDTPELAANAYDDAARRIHGGFACVNFPRPGERGVM